MATKRHYMRAALLCASTACAAPPVPAQTFPSKSIRLVAPFPAGGPIDGVARTIAPRFSELLGQQVVIDNRAGGGTVIGTEIVARAPADGHTCLIVTSAVAINPSVIPRMPYDAQRDLAAGQTQFNFSNPLGSMPLVRAGKLKVLGVGAQHRLEIAPEVPTISESGLPGFETGVWFAFFTTGGTPREIVQRLHTEMSRTLAAPDVRQKFTAGGAVIGITTPEEMAAYLRSETQKWAKVVKAAGVNAE